LPAVTAAIIAPHFVEAPSAVGDGFEGVTDHGCPVLRRLSRSGAATGGVTGPPRRDAAAR